jgi:glycosyltransferase involved in cell wall biosynthesis
VKVLHVIPALAPLYGGPSEAVIGMAKACEQNGMSVLIASTDANGPRQRMPVSTTEVQRYRGVRVRFFPRQWSESFKYSRPLAHWLDAHVREFDRVHIHAVFSHACVAAGRACTRAGVPYVVRPLGTLDPRSLQQKGVKKQFFWFLMGRRLLKRAAAVHYTSIQEKRLVEGRLGLTRGHVIPLGVEVNVDEQAPGTHIGKNDSHPYVLFLGRLHPKKNLEMLIDAFLAAASSDASLQSWRLMIAGDGDQHYVAALRARAGARANPTIEFVGWLRHEEKRSMLERASLLALVSRQENFGLAAVEALSCGVPVLVSEEIDLASEIGAAGAGWVCASEHNAVVKQLTAALTQPAERSRRGALGQEYARRFAWSGVAGELERLYSGIAAA